MEKNNINSNLITELTNIKFNEINQDLLNNESFMLNYLNCNKLNKSDYNKIPKNFLNNRYFILSVIELNPYLYKLLDKNIKKECFEIIKKKYVDYMKFADKEQKQDFSLTEEALKKSILNFLYIDDKFKKPEDVVKLLKTYKGVVNADALLNKLYKSLPDNLKTEELFKIYLKEGSYKFIVFAPEKIKNSEEIITKLILSSPYDIKYINSELIEDKEFLKKILLKLDIGAMKYERFEILYNLIPEINEKYYNLEFTVKHNEIFKRQYKNLSKEKKNNKFVLKALFLENDSLEYTSKLPSNLNELKNIIESYIKVDDNYKQRYYKLKKQDQENIHKIIDNYFLRNELQDSLPKIFDSSKENTKKLKI